MKKILCLLLVAGLAGCSSETVGPNRPPVAVAGPDRVVGLGESVTLSGVDSYDPDGNQLTSYTWTLVAAPDGASAALSSSSGMTTEFTPDVMGVWLVRLVVSDGKLDSEPDVVQVRASGCECTSDADCDDGAYCTGVERCTDCLCIPENMPDCSDGDVCTQDVCNEDLDRCENPPVTAPPGPEGPVGDATCSDGQDNDCDGMTDGADTGCIVCTTDAECDDQNVCTDDSCSGGACVNAPVNDGTACDDGLWCTDDGSGGGDVCQNGWCRGQQERDCAGAGDQCNGYACDEQADACVAVPVDDGTACDDTLWCTEDDECTDGVCGGAQRDCSGSAGECEVGVCNDDLDQCEVQAVADGGPCDDGEYCTVGETCLSGSCQGGGPRDCTEVADGCNNEACDDTADSCVAVPKSDGTECGTRSCNLLEWTRQTCTAGACTGSDTVQNCDDGRECTTDACDAATGCTHTALADGSECGAQYCDGMEHKRQTCLSGVCSGSELLTNCNDSNECTTDTCDGATGCGNANVADGTECGARYCSSLEWRLETCVSGQCTGNALQQNCDDANVCTDDTCDPAAGCTNSNNTDSCDDQDACTMNDVCANGLCAGVPLDGDGDGRVAEGCPNGDDCDDSRANVHPGMFEGPFNNAICSDSLDNDCDGLTDSADDTCQECTTDEDCDNNTVCDGVETCVGVECQPGTPLNCDNGVFCDGQETCDSVLGCQTASNPCLPESECNECNETARNCFNPAGTDCDDGQYCNGAETCNGAGVCTASVNPCLPETDCNYCNETARNCFDPVGTSCDDGLYCTGVEQCDGAGTCVASGNPCFPETECNYCNEATNICFDPVGTPCSDDGEYCTGVEECDGAGMCISSGDPCLGTECNECNENDGNCYTEAGTGCGSFSDTACTDPDTCDGAGNCQPNHAGAGAPCDDGVYCTATDTCDGSGTCEGSAETPCEGGSECNTTCNEGPRNCYDPVGTACGSSLDNTCTDPDTCDGSGTCLDNHENSGFPCDDGQYCTATDTCNGSGACQGSGTPCVAGETCDEGTDRCVTCTDNDGCLPCMWCDNGSCENQAAGDDLKDDCDLVECYTGDCDGFGNCEPEGAGIACGDGSDSDCDHPNECDGAGTCDPNYEDPGIGCDDGMYCTATDTCDGAGVCQGTGDPCLPTESCDETGDTCVQVVCTADADCPLGDICWPACSSRVNGCVTPPGSLTLVCEDPVGLPTPGASNCTITLAGGDNTGQADCLTCTAEVGVTTVDVSDFAGVGGACDLDGWTLVSGNNCRDGADNCVQSGGDRTCCSDWLSNVCDDTTFGQPVVRADDRDCGEQVRISKTFDLSGLTDLTVCFDLADHNADGNESVQLYVDGSNNPTPGVPELIFCQDGPPQDSVNDFLYTYCVDLPDWADGELDISLMFVLHSENDDDIMFLDNIVLRGWGGGCAPDLLTVLDEDFNTPSECDTTGWSFTNSDWDCPGFTCSNESGWSPGIEADNAAFDMETVVDASDLDGEITVCFQLGYDDINQTGERLTLEFDAGSGWMLAWEQEEYMGPNDQCRLICKNLSDIDSAVNNNPTLGIRFRFNSPDGEIIVYRVTVAGARYCTAGPAVVAVSSPPTGDGGGNYDFTATDTYGEQLDADITCHWDPDTSFSDVFTVHYREGAGFTKRRRLTFGNGSRGSNLLDFPVLVVLDSAWFDYTQTQDAGEDLRFFDDDGTTRLPHEIEEWNESGTSYVWVKVPQIDASSDTDFIWMVYGNPDAADDQDPPGVWTAGYVAVWHLYELGAVYYDSTGNGNDGARSGNSAAGGIIGGAQYFDGSGDHIEVAQSGLQITGGEITIEAWARPTGEPVDYCHVVGAGNDGRYWQIWWDRNWNGWHGRLRVNGDLGGMYTYDGAYDDWNYLALLYDGSERRLYWDAAEIASEGVSGNLDGINTQFWIGDNPGLFGRDFQGYVDEVRISNIYRTDDWLNAQHYSMRDWLITFGSEENL